MSSRVGVLKSAPVLVGALWVVSLFFSVQANSQNNSDGNEDERPPNFLIIVADDMGWSDLGVMGGEIQTPNLDALAGSGIVMSHFYVAPTCAPTRAMLLTGASNHEAGVGTQQGQQVANQLDDIRYAGELHDGVVTIAEVLGAKGYQSWIAGKWHVGVHPDQYPNARGFDRSFVLKEGGASHFGDELILNQSELVTYLEDDQVVALPPDFYSTISYTDKMIGYLKARDKTKPFLSYLAYTAPHDPLQVPDEWLEHYRGAYDEGPEVIQLRRLERLKEKGLFPETAALAEGISIPKFLPSYLPPWGERTNEQRHQSSRAMEVYASMIELMDTEIGRVLRYLEAEGELNNTYVLFFSDNGSSAATPLNYPGTTREWLFDERDMDVGSAGKPRSHTFLGREWAQASNTPWRFFKAVTTEGGTRSPLIVAGPTIPTGGFLDTLAHISDIAPTIYELAGVEPKSDPLFADKAQPRGISLHGNWESGRTLPERYLFTELFGNKAVWKGQWKLVQLQNPFGDGSWELYDMYNDPGESKNVAEDHPDVVAEYSSAFETYAKEVGVIEPNPQIVRSIRGTYVGECGFECEMRFSVAELIIDPPLRSIVFIALLAFVSLILGALWRRGLS